MGGGGKEGQPSVTSMDVTNEDSPPTKRAYVQEECLHWMYSRINLAQKQRSKGENSKFIELHKIEVHRIEVLDFLGKSSGAKLFVFETEDGQLRVDSNIPTTSKEVRAEHLY